MNISKMIWFRTTFALLVAFVCSGCTIVGGTIGGVAAIRHNRNSTNEIATPEKGSIHNWLSTPAAKKKKPRKSVVAYILVGAALGLVVDALVVKSVLDDFCLELSAGNPSC